jgi:hypothetical protein
MIPARHPTQSARLGQIVISAIVALLLTNEPALSGSTVLSGQASVIDLRPELVALLQRRGRSEGDRFHPVSQD